MAQQKIVGVLAKIYGCGFMKPPGEEGEGGWGRETDKVWDSRMHNSN